MVLLLMLEYSRHSWEKYEKKRTVKNKFLAIDISAISLWSMNSGFDSFLDIELTNDIDQLSSLEMNMT